MVATPALNVMVWVAPGTPNGAPAALASRIACRIEPAPLSALLLTMNCAYDSEVSARLRPTSAVLASSASRHAPHRDPASRTTTTPPVCILDHRYDRKQQAS